ncbi:transposase [Candidatus Rickettsiella viridis]|uniref:transposase n=1 Tax=Candidatus Rickettsiella viridis TaxID=676208 RepID=UPI000F842CC6|nr:transposase [Candidatus Rickettsiella viridis]
MKVCFTKENVDDRKVLNILFKNLQGLAVADRGYISKEKQETLAKKGLRFITKVRKI